MSQWETVPAYDVKRVCGYIADDGTIASYFQLSRDEVAQIRASIKQGPSRALPTGYSNRVESGLEAGEVMRRNAIFGSQRLNDTMAHLSTIPTKAAVDRAWQRYAALHCAIASDPQTQADPIAVHSLDRAHERFCKLYNEWSGR